MTRRLEVACDESGFAGGSLVGGPPVFAHASVGLDPQEAGAVVDRLRESLGVPAGELKSGRLRQPRFRPVVVALLHSEGPLAGRAHVHLTDTSWFVLARLTDVLLGPEPAVAVLGPGQDSRTRDLALRLYARGPAVLGADSWREFLTAAATLLRPSSRWLPPNPVELFAAALETMPDQDALNPVRDQLRRALPRATEIRAALAANPKLSPWMEPVVPALCRAAELWGEHGDPVAIVHDEQSAVTPERVADMTRVLADRNRTLTGVRLVDSRTDPRVQVADLLAGLARRIATDALSGQPDAELTARLSPFVDPGSTWVDTRSWSALQPQCQPSSGAR